MKKVRICIIILVSLLVFGLVLYHIPERRQITMSACTLSGKTMQIEMDIKYYRRLFAAPYVKGSVFLDGVEYIDEASIMKTFPGIVNENSNAWQFGLKEMSSFPENMIFCKKTVKDILEAGNNRIIFADIGGEDGFEKIHFMYTDESMMDESGSISGVSYYGPAATIKEAEQIAEDLGK